MVNESIALAPFSMRLHSLALLLLTLLHLGTAYVISSDCYPEDLANRQLLTTKFDGTFARITQTISQMKLVLMNSPDKNDFIERTMSMLFNPEDFETVISRLENLYLESHENRETQSDTNDFSTPRTDTLAYCTDGHLTKTWTSASGDVYTDHVWFYKYTTVSEYGRCFSGLKDRIWMFTGTFGAGTINPSTIQMCPWYVEEWLNPSAQKLCKDWTDLSEARRAELTAKGKTPADGVSDFIFTLGHEFMHTLAGGDLKDVYVDGISPWGFTNCVKRKSATNPDSYAFLETMIEQIISCGLAPDEDGNMNPIPNWKAPSSPKKGGITVLGERDTDLISETGNNTTTDLEAGKDVTNLTSHALIDGEWIQVSANLLH